jgi:hypothetical protein
VSFFNCRAPASRYGLYAGRRVVAVDGEPTPDLEAFVRVAKAVGDKESVRLNTMSFNDVPEVITLKLDPQYWPSYELRRDGYDWRRTELQ